MNVARSVWAWIGIVKGDAVVSENGRNEGNTAYSASPYVAVVHPTPQAVV